MIHQLMNHRNKHGVAFDKEQCRYEPRSAQEGKNPDKPPSGPMQSARRTQTPRKDDGKQVAAAYRSEKLFASFILFAILWHATSLSCLVVSDASVVRVPMTGTLGTTRIDTSVARSNSPLPSNTTNSIGRRIVHSSYAKTFAHLVQRCPNPASTDTEFIKCLKDFRRSLDRSSFPWWFGTLVRDTSSYDGGIGGAWHRLYIKEPANLEMCVIEKIGTKRWRDFQCLANHPAESLSNHACDHTVRPTSSIYQRSVFLRDPLDRFLSGFLDKCIDEAPRGGQHCQPLSVFNPRTDLMKEFWKSPNNLFEIYVNSFPLQWNLHFIPQSFICRGLYAHIGDYDFVGHMNNNFYHDLSRFANQYNVQDPVERAFNTSLSLDGNNKNEGVETNSISKTSQFFTPRTVRMVLEYMAIDYVLLDLPIPQWAEDMLKQEYDEYNDTNP